MQHHAMSWSKRRKSDMSLYMDHFKLMIPTRPCMNFGLLDGFCAVILRFTNDVAVSVDMMFQMVRCMGFDLHYHEVRKLMYLVEAGLHQHASRCFIQTSISIVPTRIVTCKKQWITLSPNSSSSHCISGQCFGRHECHLVATTFQDPIPVRLVKMPAMSGTGICPCRRALERH